MQDSPAVPTTNLADVAGVVIDLAQTPDYGPPRDGEVVVRSTGRGYRTDDGDLVAEADAVVHGDGEA